jgi:TPR repeat protein
MGISKHFWLKTRTSIAYTTFLVCFLSLYYARPALAADIGGWMESQRSKDAGSAQTCAAQIEAAKTHAPGAPQAAQSYFQAALCYLAGQQVAQDPVAAKAWLARAAELQHLPAHRLLASMQAAETGAHPASYHCHDIGYERKICHGAAPQASPQVQTQ